MPGPEGVKKELNQERKVREGCDFRLRSLEERMDKTEEIIEVIHKISTNVELIVLGNTHRDEKIDEIAKAQKDTSKQIEALEKQPLEELEETREKWDKVKWTLITIFCTGAAFYLLSNFSSFIASLQ